MAQFRAPDATPLTVPDPPTGLERVQGLAESLLENPVARGLLYAMPGYALVLTLERRVLAGQEAVLEELGLTTPEGLERLRAGELFRCVPVRDGFSRIRQFRVSTAPLRMGRQDYLLFIFKDITELKSRETLEQVFLHDLLNLVGGLDGLGRRLQDPGEDPRTSAGLLKELSRQLTDEIQNQRILLCNEEGCLAAGDRETWPGEILDRLGRFFSVCGAADGRRLDILPAASEPFMSNPVLLTRVLVNLVKNALEATPGGGTVKVWHERREGRTGFVVENPGQIPEEIAGRIFERSFSTKGEAGRGLGTYGAKFLGERFLGGEVGFAAQEGAATRFFIWMPEPGTCPAAGGTDPGRAAAASQGFGPCPEDADTLLVVDDSRTLCRLLGNLLCPRYRVLTAETGEAGIALAMQVRPDLILLDVMMPDMDGFAVCRRLKGDSRTREIPVLFLTALGGEAEEMRALEAGGIDFLPKPISPPVLAARVRNLLELKHQQDRLRNLSLLDGLTGIANRRRFDQYLEMEWHRCSRNVQPLSLVMGDVDFFKAYNDGYGHGRGDECLRAVAKVFGLALRRPADLAARYGGEEFVCLLPETDQEGARIVADQVMAQMRELALPHAYSPIARQVTVSVGLATAERPSPARPCRTLVEEADMWMYEAKGRGRNRVEGFLPG
jgi:diguanylate cyclase (GGDEF)-like protein